MEQTLPAPESEIDLVQRAVRRDRAAFTALYDRHVDQVFRHAYYRLSNQTDAEDVTQETFIRAWKAIHKYRPGPTPFAAWLLTIARHLVIDHYKKHPREQTLDELDETKLVARSPDPQAIAERNFNSAAVKQAVLKLKGDKQKVIMMHFIDGFDYEEIAAALKKSPGAVRVLQHRALVELRDYIKHE